MCFSLGELDVTEKIGICNFLFEGILCLETNNMVLVPLMRLVVRRDLPPPCAKRKKSFAVEISHVALLGTEQRVWSYDLAPVGVLMTAPVVSMAGFG